MCSVFTIIRTIYPVRTNALNRLAKVSAVEFDAKVMFDLGLISNIKVPVKVLAFGTLDKAITVKVNAISAKAKAAIEAAGGKVEIV